MQNVSQSNPPYIVSTCTQVNAVCPGGGEVMDKFVHSRDVVQKYYD